MWGSIPGGVDADQYARGAGGAAWHLMKPPVFAKNASSNSQGADGKLYWHHLETD